MKLKIFIPDFNEKIDKKVCVPPLYPFISDNLTFDQKKDKYGDWINSIDIVDTVKKSDIAIPAHYVNYYYANDKYKTLLKFNHDAYSAHKLTVCWTNGDWGVTPKLRNFHLFRYGGYLSRNAGNQFCWPFFLSRDPLSTYYNGHLNIQERPEKPVIGFCGRASNDLFGVGNDVTKNLGRFALKLINRWTEDVEFFQASSFRRFQMLKKIERSDTVKTNFILSNKFLGGRESPGEKEDQRRIFFQNLKDSHYIFCYRGWGNYSIRLYETMAAGRIPVIITSNNNLPFISKINWNIFPVIKSSDSKNIAKILSEFHGKLSNEEFVALQLTARKIWEEYFTYKGFMKKWVDNYTLNKFEG
jgi:hypothetical protein